METRDTICFVFSLPSAITPPPRVLCSARHHITHTHAICLGQCHGNVYKVEFVMTNDRLRSKKFGVAPRQNDLGGVKIVFTGLLQSDRRFFR